MALLAWFAVGMVGLWIESCGDEPFCGLASIAISTTLIPMYFVLAHWSISKFIVRHYKYSLFKTDRQFEYAVVTSFVIGLLFWILLGL